MKRVGQFEEYYEFIVPTELKYRDINGKQYTKDTEMIIRFTFIKGDNTKVFCNIKSGQPYLEQSKEFKEEGGEKDIIKMFRTR